MKMTRFEPIEIEFEHLILAQNFRKNETRYQSGFQKMVGKTERTIKTLCY